MPLAGDTSIAEMYRRLAEAFDAEADELSTRENG